MPIVIVGNKAEVIRPIQRTILQGVGNIILDTALEISNVCISETGIFQVADIEAELANHCLEAYDPQMHIRVSEVDSIVSGTVIADKEIRN